MIHFQYGVLPIHFRVEYVYTYLHFDQLPNQLRYWVQKRFE